MTTYSQSPPSLPLLSLSLSLPLPLVSSSLSHVLPSLLSLMQEISQTKIFKLDEDDHGTRIITLAEINVGDSMPGEMDEKAGIQRNMWL